MLLFRIVFFFQAEDGIRDVAVTGVQTCALPIYQGTTSSRAIVFDHSGSVVASAQKEFRQIFPKPGWVEHDATEIWATQLHTATEAIAKAGLTAADIAGIGITNHRETTVVWDRETGEPVSQAIVWEVPR